MSPFRIFTITTLPYIKNEKFRILFTIIGVLLGISLYTSIRITTENILISFEASANYVGNRDVIQIVSDTGSVSEAFIPKLLALPEINTVTPVSTKQVRAYSGNKDLGYIYIIGIDILAINQMMQWEKQEEKFDDLSNYIKFLLDQPIHAFASKKIADQSKNLNINLLIDGILKPIKIKKIIPKTTKMAAYGDYAIIIDIKNFQNLFRNYEFIDRLNLTFNTKTEAEGINKVNNILPKNLRISQGNDNAKYAKDITSTFRFNLNFITCLTLLVTMIIIYNSISYYVLERRRDFGIMLMLGAQPWTLVLTSIFAITLLVIFCCALGIFLGYLIAQFTIHLATETISNIFLPVRVSEVHLPSHLIVEVFIIAIMISLIASILPCLEIYRIPLQQTTAYQTYEKEFQTKIFKVTAIGIIILIMSLLCLTPALLKLSDYFAYVSLSGVLFSTAFFLPIILFAFLKIIRTFISKFSIEATLAAEHIKATMRKNVVAIAAMSITISLYFSTMILIDSTQYTVMTWIDHVLTADVYISDKNSSFELLENYLPKNLLAFIEKNSDIQAYNFLVHKDIFYQNKPLRVIGTRYSTIGKYYKINFVHPMSDPVLQNILSDANNAFISETFSNRFNLKIGDVILLPTNKGNFPVKIANVFYNYTSDRNTILISNSLFTQLYDESRVQNLMLYLKNPGDFQKIINAINKKFSNLHLQIQNRTEMKKTAEDITDQAFRISNVILLITMVVAAITLLNTLEQLIFSRRHEFTIFWSLGANDYKLIKMCLWESFIICSAAILNAIIPTVIGVFIILNYLNNILFGTVIFLHISYSSIFSFAAILFIIAMLVGLIPAFQIKKFINLEGLRYE